jgi:hypothetical protein
VVSHAREAGRRRAALKPEIPAERGWHTWPVVAARRSHRRQSGGGPVGPPPKQTAHIRTQQTVERYPHVRATKQKPALLARGRLRSSRRSPSRSGASSAAPECPACWTG